MPVSEALREAQKRYREKNREKYRETQRKYAMAHYWKNREAYLEKKKIYYLEKTRKANEFLKEWNRLCNINIYGEEEDDIER